MSDKNPEPRDKNQDFNEIEALDKIQEYRDRVVEINKCFSNIHYALYQHTNHKLLRDSFRMILEGNFEYLGSSENQFYINSIGNFSQMYRHLKARYEAEVLNAELSTQKS